MPIISTKNLNIYYERSPDRDYEPLLYIGGTAGDLRNKPNQMDSPLNNFFEVISYDQRGLGQTEVPSGEYSMQQYAHDAANLLDALKIESINVFGVSFGGMVAQELTIRHPSRVKKLVLACTSSGGKGGSSYPLHELEELDPETKLEKSIQINDLRISNDWIKNNQETWSEIKLTTQERKMVSPDQENLLKQLSARKGHDTFDRLKQIDTPVLLTGGKYDGIAPVSNMKSLQLQIKGSELKFYEGGHLFLVQDKQAFKDICMWLSA
jgi:3-oxoadipate enol-lactonase